MSQQPSILIVEDEFLIRFFLDEVFQDAGWLVTLASNGDEAVELLNGHDAVITDVEMPGKVDGLALSWQVYRRNPRVPVVIMSGRVLPTKASLPPTARFIAKPAPVDVLLETISALTGVGLPDDH